MSANKKKLHSLNYAIDGPFLDTITTNFPATANSTTFPFNIPVVKNLQEIRFASPVTFFIGENGSGKSTILEAFANKAGFGTEGGSRNINFNTSIYDKSFSSHNLAEYLTFSWRFKPTNGYFFRAESFFNVANYLDYLANECGGGEQAFAPYGGKSLHHQSHGESFLSFFKNRLGSGGFFIFDEPEAALSPQRQLVLLTIMHDLCKNYRAQFIIATHSPLLLAFPNAVIYSCDGNALSQVAYEDTQHYKITKKFLDNPARYLLHLFDQE